MRHYLIGLMGLLLSLNVLARAPLFYDRIGRIKTLQAHYTQEVKLPSGRVVERSAGEMFMRRPNKLRWISVSDPKQIIIADGTKLWIFDPELDQVMVKKQSEALDRAPASLLTGKVEDIQALFKIKQKTDHFTLTPKSNDSGYKRIEFIFKRGTYVPEKMAFVDELDQVTIIEFIGAKVNSPIEAGKFTFKVPQGVDVVE